MAGQARKLKPRPKICVDIQEDRLHSAQLGAVDILELLRHAGYEIPNNADVTFRTPGGGDWSNTDVELDSDGAAGEQVVKVSWKTTTTRTEGLHDG